MKFEIIHLFAVRMAYDARRTGKPGYVCHYCSTQFRGKTVRSVLQHTIMYHQAAVKKFENHPLRNPLVSEYQARNCL